MTQDASSSQDSDAQPVTSGPGHRPAVEMTSLSDDLQKLKQTANGQSMTLRQIMDHLKDRGHMMFVIVIIGPFLFLPTTFGLSTPIGFAIAIIGLCITAGMKPWLPDFILRKEFPSEGLEKILDRASRMSQRVEKIARPRLGVMLWPGLLNLAGLELTLWAALMALPGPNFIFAFMITLIAFGLLMRDGVLLLLAHVLTLISPVLVYIFWDEIWGFTVSTWEKIWDKLHPLWEKLQAMIGFVSMIQG